MDPAKTLLHGIELLVCGGGAELRERVLWCVAGHDVRVRTVPSIEALLCEPPSPRGMAVAVVLSGGVEEDALQGWAGMPVLRIARPGDDRGGHPDALPHDFTLAEFRGAAGALAQMASAGAALPDNAGSFITRSPAMQAVIDEVNAFADCEHSVLIQGETGTGKERIASLLHEGNATYGRGPLVPVNCGAVPDTLFESLFFGHERGAFTGALHLHKGYLEQADGGTLFLDEIGELPRLQQVKLLRALENGEVMRVGAEVPTRVRFRLVAATNRDLRAFVDQGTFRADLYYRIAVIELHLPSLEERGIGDKIAIFRAMAGRVLGAKAQALGEPPMWLNETVARMRFPGNVRQLRNLAERVGVIARQTRRWDREMIGRALAMAQGMSPPSVPLRRNWDPGERVRVLDALHANGWKRTETARELGISRKVLWEKMRKYQISEGETGGRPDDVPLKA